MNDLPQHNGIADNEEMKKQPSVDFVSLPRDTALNIRVPTAWKEYVKAEYKRAKKQPGGERYRSLAAFVMLRMIGQ